MAMKELIESYNKKDFNIDWFSGSGAGGQHRNKHQNCCRLTHLPTGIVVQGTESRERPANLRKAFERLADKLKEHHQVDRPKEISNERIRDYHSVRNVVKDMASGLEMEFDEVLNGKGIDEMIKKRKQNI